MPRPPWPDWGLGARSVTMVRMRTSASRALATAADRIGVPVRAVVAAVGLLVTSAVAVIGFGGLTEDVAARNGQQHFDLRRLDWFVHHRSHAEIRIADALANVGAVGAMAVVAVVAAALLWQRRASLAVVLAPPVAFVVAAGVVTVTKALVGRGRPPVPLRLVSDSEPSFPSGHATVTTAVVLTVAIIVATVVCRRRVARSLVVVAGAGFAAAVGVSRLVLGAHWPTDVEAGWLLGSAVSAIVLAVAVLLEPRVPTGPDAGRVWVARWRRWRGRPDVAAAPTAPAHV